jgi:VWFA-related protein
MKHFAALAVAAALLSAQEPEFKVRSNLVFLPTRVQTGKGETIYGLKPEQFMVEDNGVRQQINVEESPESTGVSLVVAVQCGRSAVTEFNKLKGLGTMIGAIVGDAPHEVSVVSYGDGPNVLSDFSSSSESVRHALTKLKPCGDYGAASIDTVDFAINLLQRRPNNYRRAILLIGETRDHGSRSKLHQVVAELGMTDTVVYSVAFSPVRDDFINGLHNPDHPPPPAKSLTPPPLYPETEKGPAYTEHAPLFALPPQLMAIVNALRRNTASELATLSGGEYMNFATQKGFDQSLQRISNQIHNYYLLSFRPSSSQAIGLHTLTVRISDFPEAAIQTRRNYWSGILEP